MEVLKKNMGKLLIALAVAALAFCLVGCSGSGSGQAEQKKSSEPSALEIVNSGYTFDNSLADGAFTYGVLVRNSNEDYAAQYQSVKITGRDKDGNVVGTFEDFLPVIFANGENAIGGSGMIEGAETLEFEIESGTNSWAKEDIQQSEVDDTWHAVDVSNRTSYGTTTIAGEIESASDKTLASSRINVLLFDKDGAIVGGGYTYATTVSSNSKTSFSVDIYNAPKFSDVKVFFDPGDVKE